MHKSFVLSLLVGAFLLAACLPSVEIRKPIGDAMLAEQARQNGSVRWQTGLGAAVIESLNFLDGNKILVLLKKDDLLHSPGDILLLARESGRILWRYPRQSLPGEYALILQTENALIFRIDYRGKIRLLALDIATGKEGWRREFKTDSVDYFPLPGADLLLIIEQRGDASILHGFDPFTGKDKWRRRFEVRTAVPPPVVSASEIWLFFDGVEKLDARHGKRLWHRGDIRLDADAPLPQLDGRRLYLVDADGRLHGLSRSSGKTVFTSHAAVSYRISNIYPLGKRVYLRGRKPAAPEAGLSPEERIRLAASRAASQAVRKELGSYDPGDGEYRLLALSGESGELLWRAAWDAPSVSNIIESKGNVYHATVSHLIALDGRTGKRRFAVQVTDAGKGYPVHLRLIGDMVVFLGEWIVAAFDRKTGRQRYLQGMNPVPDSRATMAGLDDTLEKLYRELGEESAVTQSVSAMLGRAAVNSQNLSNHYQRQVLAYRSQARTSRGSTAGHFTWKAAQAQNRAQIEGAFSSAYSSIAMTVAIQELNEQLKKVSRQLSVAADIEDLTVFRKALLGGFPRSENHKYYYRPHNDLRGFVGVSIVNLQTGKRRDVMLSPRYRDYGIWNLVDLERGVIYHHGIGLDTERHRYIELKYGMNRFLIYESQLVAQEVKLP